MIIGIDVSTSKIGIAIIRKETNEIIYVDVLKLPPKSTLEERAWLFKDKLKEVKEKYNIDRVFVEKPFFSGGINANTTSILLRFNGMCCYLVFDVLNKIPSYVDPRQARSFLGIHIPRKKKLTQKEKKQIIINNIVTRYENTKTPFLYEKNKKENPIEGTDDIADAIVLALAGPVLLQ